LLQNISFYILALHISPLIEIVLYEIMSYTYDGLAFCWRWNWRMWKMINVKVKIKLTL